jgi:hypothetical protein
LKVSASKTKCMGMCGNDIQRLKIVTEGKIFEQIMEFNYIQNKISEYTKAWNVNYKNITESME